MAITWMVWSYTDENDRTTNYRFQDPLFRLDSDIVVSGGVVRTRKQTRTKPVVLTGGKTGTEITFQMSYYHDRSRRNPVKTPFEIMNDLDSWIERDFSLLWGEDSLGAGWNVDLTYTYSRDRIFKPQDRLNPRSYGGIVPGRIVIDVVLFNPDSQYTSRVAWTPTQSQ